MEWYIEKICSKCKNRVCEKASSGVYVQDWTKKLFCIYAFNVMAQIDRPKFREKLKEK